MEALTILSEKNYGRYNRVWAETIGLTESIYLEAILDICAKAECKKTIDALGYIPIDRKYVTSQTTIKKTDQHNIDKKFEDLKLIRVDPNNKDRICVYQDQILGMCVNLAQIKAEDVPIITQTRNKRSAKEMKNEAIKESLRSHITTPNRELQVALCKWIEALVDIGRPLPALAVDKAQQDLIDLCKDNTNMALEIVQNCIANGYVDMTYGHQVYYQKHRAIDGSPRSTANMAFSPLIYNPSSNEKQSEGDPEPEITY